MAQSLVIRNHCDICLEDGKETPADTYSVTVQIVTSDPDVYESATAGRMEPADNPRPFVVELCPQHAAPLAEAVLAVLKYGRPPERTPRKAPAPAGGTPRKRKDERPEPLTCPECGHVSPNRAALRVHLSQQHSKTLAAVGLEETIFTCEDCGAPYGSGQGYASHVRAMHPDTWRRKHSA